MLLYRHCCVFLISERTVCMYFDCMKCCFPCVSDVYLCAVLVCCVGLLCMCMFTIAVSCQYLQRKRRLKGRILAVVDIKQSDKQLMCMLMMLLIIQSAHWHFFICSFFLENYNLVKSPQNRWENMKRWVKWNVYAVLYSTPAALQKIMMSISSRLELRNHIVYILWRYNQSRNWDLLYTCHPMRVTVYG